MADGFRIAEGYLDINADPSAAMRNVMEFLRQVDRRLDRAEDDFEDSGRRSGRRFGDGLEEGLRGAHGGNLITDLVFGGGGGGGGGGEGGGGGGFIQGLISSISGGFRRILDEVRDLISDIESLLSGMGGGGGFLSGLQEDLQDLISDIRGGLVSVISWLQSAWIRSFGLITSAGVRTFFSDLLTRARAYWTRFTAWASTSFAALWTRIRGWWGSMNSSLRSFWTRFSTWAGPVFRRLQILGEYFWLRFRYLARSTFNSLNTWTRAWISALGIMGRWAFTQLRRWAGGIWSGMRTRGAAVWTRILSLARSALTTLQSWFGSFFTWLSSVASSAWGHLTSAFEQLGKVAGQLGPVLQIAAYAALIPVVLALGGAIANLIPLLLLLPAAIATLVSILAPAIVAFKGFGEAVGAGLSGDVEKFNEALKKLTPNARAVAKEFVALGPALRNIKRWTQNALFLPLIGTIKPLATTLLPALEQGMAKAASGLGRLLAGFAKMLATPEVISAINTLFATTERILDRLGPPLASLFGALFGTIEGGLPWIERFVDVVANGIQRFADWLRLIKGNGQMQSWLKTAWDTAKDLWAVIVQLGLVIKNLFADSGDEGQGFLKDLANALERLNKWLSSDNGKEFLDDLVDTIIVVAVAIDYLVWVIGFLGDTWLIVKESAKSAWDWMKSAWNWISGAFADAGRWLADFGRISWDWIKDAASAIGDFFVSVGGWFVDAYNTVVSWGGAILAWFGNVPGWIAEFFANLPGWIMTGLAAIRDAIFYGIGWIAGFVVGIFMSIPGALAAAWEWISTTVMNGVTKTADFIRTLPQRAQEALSSLGSTIGGAVDAAWDWAFESTSKGVQYSWQKTQELIGRTGEILSELPGRVGGIITNAWNRGRDSTNDGIGRVVSAARELPGKVGGALADAGSWLYSVGQNMIRGLINGISSMWGWAVDQARAAASAIKKGFLDALEIGSPSRVMRVEVGRWIMPGVVEGIKDTIPDTQRYLGAVANMMVEGFAPTVSVAAPNVHTGDTMLQADFGEGIRQVVPLIITRNPRIVSGAADVGKRQRAGWVNTGRGTVG